MKWLWLVLYAALVALGVLHYKRVWRALCGLGFALAATFFNHRLGKEDDDNGND